MALADNTHLLVVDRDVVASVTVTVSVIMSVIVAVAMTMAVVMMASGCPHAKEIDR